MLWRERERESHAYLQSGISIAIEKEDIDALDWFQYFFCIYLSLISIQNWSLYSEVFSSSAMDYIDAMI